jgi:ribosomal protein L13
LGVVKTDWTVPTVPTYNPKPGEIARDWHVIDASDVVLGRLASQAATLLRGKHKPQFAPHVDVGDFVVIVNAEKVAVHPSKLKVYAGPDHPHRAQQPKPFKIDQVAQGATK